MTVSVNRVNWPRIGHVFVSSGQNVGVNGYNLEYLDIIYMCSFVIKCSV